MIWIDSPSSINAKSNYEAITFFSLLITSSAAKYPNRWKSLEESMMWKKYEDILCVLNVCVCLCDFEKTQMCTSFLLRKWWPTKSHKKKFIKRFQTCWLQSLIRWRYKHTHTHTLNSILHAFTLHASTTLQCQFHHSVSLITLDHYWSCYYWFEVTL